MNKESQLSTIDLGVLALVARKLDMAIQDEPLEDQVRLIGVAYNLCVNPRGLFEGDASACDDLMNLLWSLARGLPA